MVVMIRGERKWKTGEGCCWFKGILKAGVIGTHGINHEEMKEKMKRKDKEAEKGERFDVRQGEMSVSGVGWRKSKGQGDIKV